MSVYLSYYANRMLLQRDLGTMVVDEEGKWVEAPLDGSAQAATMPMGFEGLDDETPMVPPALPEHLQEIIDAQPPTNEPTPAPARSAEIQSRFSGQVES